MGANSATTPVCKYCPSRMTDQDSDENDLSGGATGVQFNYNGTELLVSVIKVYLG